MKKIIKLNRLLSLLKSLIALFAFISAVLFLDVQTALAHRPHDVITQVQISPNYEQDKTVFIIARGNLFASNDEGDSWKRIVKGLDNKLMLSGLSLSSQNSKILFLSTWGDGIYKSQDGGNSWFKVNNGLGSLDIDLIAISSDSPEIVFAAGRKNSLYKTKDGGKNWYSVITNSNKITAMAFFANNPNQIVIGDDLGNIFLSKDGGEAWQKTFTAQNSGSITAITVSPNFASDNTFWVATEKIGILKTVDNGSSFSEANKRLADKNVRDIVVSPHYQKGLTLWASTHDQGIFYSKDGGDSWNKSSRGLIKDSQADETQFKSPHFSDLEISSAFDKDKTLFVSGFNGLFKSTDGGLIWSELETLSTRTIIALSVSPNYKNDASVALATYVGEAYISQDKGVTWTSINKGLKDPDRTQGGGKPRFFDIVFSPNYQSDNTIFSTLLWDNFLKSTNQGKDWKVVRVKKAPGSSTRGMTIVPSPNFASDQTIYLGSQKGSIFKSTDGGLNFSLVGQVGSKFHNAPLSLVISPTFSSDKTLYSSSPNGGIHKTVDGGSTWQPTTNGTPLAQKVGIQLAISPNYKVDQTVFAGSDLGLFSTKDGGKTWTKIPESSYGEDGFIESLALSPNYASDQTIVMSVKGRGLFKTVNGGESFTPISKNLLDNNYSLSRMGNIPSAGIPLVFSPSYAVDRTLYGFGSSTTEVFKSTDGGNNWETIAISRPKNINFMGWLNSIYLRINAYAILRFIVAAIASSLSYLAFGYLASSIKVPFSKLQFRAIGSFIVFVGVFLLLSL